MIPTMQADCRTKQTQRKDSMAANGNKQNRKSGRVCARAHLLCDGEANDEISLRNVPGHHGGVCFQRCDGHIDGRR